MKYKYEGTNKVRKTINEIGEVALILYAVLGSAYNLATKTGHPSADIATGRSQPTALEKGLEAFGEALLTNSKMPSLMPSMK